MRSYSEINNPELIAIEHDPVKRIKMIANTNWHLLNECCLYLNYKGKVAKKVHSIIEDACEFAETLDEVKGALEEEIKANKNDDVKRRLQTFIKGYLK